VTEPLEFAGKKSLQWEPVQSGVWVLKLWNGVDDPQIAILQCTYLAYEKLRENLSQFLTDNKIFPAAVQPQSGPGAVMTNLKQQHTRVFLVIQHGKPSRSPYVMLSGDPAPDSPDWVVHPRGPAPILG
jgi:hypothetical protein